jgi:hypothetical protein
MQQGCNVAVKTGADTLRLNIDFRDVDTVGILFPYATNPIPVETYHRAAIETALAQCVIDTALNGSGAMAQTGAADYALILHYRGMRNDENSWVQLWKESRHASVGDKWYLMPENSGALFDMLDTYRK